MARPKKSIDKETIMRAEERFKKLEEGKLAMQIRVVIAFGDNSAEEVAKVFKISSRSVFRWVKEFKKNDIDGLMGNPKGHCKSKLTDEQKAQIKRWIISGKNSNGKDTHWTLQKLKVETYKKFGVIIGITTLWENLQKMRLAIKKPRPIHHKADKEQQEEFKKN